MINNFAKNVNCSNQNFLTFSLNLLYPPQQFALYADDSNEECRDWLELFDVFRGEDGREVLKLQGNDNDGYVSILSINLRIICSSIKHLSLISYYQIQPNIAEMCSRAQQSLRADLTKCA